VRNRLQKRSFAEDKYNCELELADNRFGKIMIWSHKKGEDILIMKKRKSKTAEECLRNIQHAKERLKINQNYLMKMIDFSVKVNSLEAFEVWGFYEAPLLDLKKEILSRSKKNR
jgi:hypothetical protein